MKNNKKAQAIIEFFMPYVWAILIVLVVICVLIFFGVLNPDSFSRATYNPDVHNCIFWEDNAPNDRLEKCIGFTEKSKCEVNTRADGCICDEWYSPIFQSFDAYSEMVTKQLYDNKILNLTEQIELSKLNYEVYTAIIAAETPICLEAHEE